MTVLDSPPEEEVPTRRRWGKVALAILAALVLLAGLSWVALTSLYAPLEPNGFGGARGAMKSISSPVDGTVRILTGPENGTGEVLIGLRNEGPLPVRLLGGGFDQDFEVPVEVNWAPDMSPRDHLMGGHPDEVRPFPVTLPPGGQITISVTVTKRGCANYRDGWFGAAFSRIPLRWSVLGRERVHVIEARTDSDDTGMDPIVACPSDEQVKQLQ